MGFRANSGEDCFVDQCLWWDGLITVSKEGETVGVSVLVSPVEWQDFKVMANNFAPDTIFLVGEREGGEGCPRQVREGEGERLKAVGAHP